jgi:hypothetical protein
MEEPVRSLSGKLPRESESFGPDDQDNNHHDKLVHRLSSSSAPSQEKIDESSEEDDLRSTPVIELDRESSSGDD